MMLPGTSADLALGIDPQELERALSVGGPELRPALVTQVVADLLRLRGAIATAGPAGLGPAAHELKGLAATLGAQGLAELAAALDLALERGAVPAADLAAICADLCRLIDEFCALLRGDGATRAGPA